MYITNICVKVERTFNITIRKSHSPPEEENHLDLDVTDTIEEDEVSKYQMLIGPL